MDCALIRDCPSARHTFSLVSSRLATHSRMLVAVLLNESQLEVEQPGYAEGNEKERYASMKLKCAVRAAKGPLDPSDPEHPKRPP
jgi:hypothetical protein